MGEAPIQRTVAHYRQALLEHFYHQTAYESAERALISMRRVGCWYIKSSRGTREFRHRMSRAQTIAEARDLIMEFPIDMDDVHVDSESRNDRIARCRSWSSARSWL